LGRGIVPARGGVDGSGGPEFVGVCPPGIKAVGNASGVCETGPDGGEYAEGCGGDGAWADADADALLKVW
jgi:hypothetical protein